MPASPRPPRAPKGVTFTVRPAPGLTREERLARRLRAVEALLARRVDAPPLPEAGDGAGDSPERRPASPGGAALR
jgi:hypothetical protein